MVANPEHTQREKVLFSVRAICLMCSWLSKEHKLAIGFARGSFAPGTSRAKGN